MKPNGKPGSFYLARALAITLDLLIFALGESTMLLCCAHSNHNFNFPPSTAVATLVFIEFYAENSKRGFFCGDTSISFKHQKDTISIKAVVVYALTPIIVVSVSNFSSQKNINHLTHRCLLNSSGSSSSYFTRVPAAQSTMAKIIRHRKPSQHGVRLSNGSLIMELIWCSCCSWWIRLKSSLEDIGRIS